MGGVSTKTPAPTIEALWRLKDLEQAIVDVGYGRMGDKDGSLRALELGGYLVQISPGVWSLTERGWITSHAFRRHVAANREALSLTGILPPFTGPPPPDEAAERHAMARDMFVQTFATASSDVDAAALADRVIAFAQVFIDRKDAAGL
jgi:hypothetical protein